MQRTAATIRIGLPSACEVHARQGEERVSRSEQPSRSLLAVTRYPVTRRRFLGLIGISGLGAYAGAHAWSLPEGFYERTVESPLPVFDPRTYRLVVDGLVQRPLSFTYRQLLWLPSSRQTCDFRCIEGWGVDDVPWQGVRLTTLMALARPLHDARFVTFHCLGDTYQESLSMEQARLSNALLASCMYDHPLLPERGSPLRLVFPRMLGYKGAKWVTGLEFRSERDLGYWETMGAPVDPWVQNQQPCSACGPGRGPSYRPWFWSGRSKSGLAVTLTPTAKSLPPGCDTPP